MKVEEIPRTGDYIILQFIKVKGDAGKMQPCALDSKKGIYVHLDIDTDVEQFRVMYMSYQEL